MHGSHDVLADLVVGLEINIVIKWLSANEKQMTLQLVAL